MVSRDGKELPVLTYIADPSAIDENLRPYSWYKDFVLKGAAEHPITIGILAIVDPDKNANRLGDPKLGYS